jgi:hypothetical protein
MMMASQKPFEELRSDIRAGEVSLETLMATTGIIENRARVEASKAGTALAEGNVIGLQMHAENAAHFYAERASDLREQMSIARATEAFEPGSRGYVQMASRLSSYLEANRDARDFLNEMAESIRDVEPEGYRNLRARARGFESSLEAIEELYPQAVASADLARESARLDGADAVRPVSPVSRSSEGVSAFIERLRECRTGRERSAEGPHP